MPEKKKTAPKKTVAKKAAAKKAKPKAEPAVEVRTEPKCYVEITENGTRVGSMLFAAGKRVNLPLEQAKALEAIGKGRIVGV